MVLGGGALGAGFDKVSGKGFREPGFGNQIWEPGCFGKQD